MRGAGLALVLMLAACGSSSAPRTQASIAASPSPAATNSFLPHPAPLASPSTVLRTASLACTSPIPMSGQLALVSLDSQAAAIDLVSNPSRPQLLCKINNVFTLAPTAAWGPRFVSRSEVSYVDLGVGGILRLDLTTGISTTVVNWNS